MAIFGVLPSVNYCCGSVSLKLGTALIALLGIISIGNGIGVVMFPMCPDGYGLTYAGYVFGATEVIVCLASLLLLIGLCTDNSFTATIFLYAATLYILIALIFVGITIFSVLSFEDCNLNFSLIGIVLAFLLAFYFMIVVKSQRDDMAD